jgi:peptidoglycan hydrolase CwlO-like protein
MQLINWRKQVLRASGLAAVLMLVQSGSALGQTVGGETPEGAQKSEEKVNPAEVVALLRQLQYQVRELNAEVGTLREQQQSAQTESAALRKELDQTKSQLVALSVEPKGATHDQIASSAAVPQKAIDERISKIEEYQQVNDARAAEQSQTKVESSSKYRVRLSGIVLFNTYVNRGAVDNEDFPQIATAPGPLSSDGSFGASLRQSQIGLQGFGPSIAGARTSAELHLDFAGGFPEVSNGVSFGIMRLRTATVRFDWEKTSIIAGQDSLFIAPLSPTSIATLATPAFAYSGNLWSWAPQIRVEHHFAISDSSSLLLQGGILDSQSGELPASAYYRSPTWGESSGQPAYAARVAWSQEVRGENMTFGVGGYYGRQAWGFGRSIDSWTGTMDLKLPLGKTFEFTGQAYRGRATGGLSGGIGQSVVWKGNFLDPATDLYGLHSIGGWTQLKYKATTKLQFNGAFGLDNPSAGDLRQFGGSQNYYPLPLSKNQSALVNFLYQPRSDVVLSLEYRRLKTFTLDSNTNSANIINFSMGYIF